MPRWDKDLKQEWLFFIGANGRRQYNRQCMRCEHGCKQSFRAVIVRCEQYASKRRIGKE